MRDDNNQAGRRHIDRFPPDFMFQLTADEIEDGCEKAPLAFTEYGVAMLSSVLTSERAVQVKSRSCEHSTRFASSWRHGERGRAREPARGVAQFLDGCFHIE
jgi:hypothetical protein